MISWCSIYYLQLQQDLQLEKVPLKQKMFSLGKMHFHFSKGFQLKDKYATASGLLTFTVTSCVDLWTSELPSIRSYKLQSVCQELPGENQGEMKKKLEILCGGFTSGLSRLWFFLFPSVALVPFSISTQTFMSHSLSYTCTRICKPKDEKRK